MDPLEFQRVCITLFLTDTREPRTFGSDARTQGVYISCWEPTLKRTEGPPVLRGEGEPLRLAVLVEFIDDYSPPVKIRRPHLGLPGPPQPG